MKNGLCIYIIMCSVVLFLSSCFAKTSGPVCNYCEEKINLDLVMPPEDLLQKINNNNLDNL